MDEYIKRKEAILTVKGYAKHAIDKGRKCLDAVDDTIHMCDEIDCLLAADVAPVVRCKNCKHYDMGVCLKIYSDGNVHSAAWQSRKPDDFCSYGERKDGGADNE